MQRKQQQMGQQPGFGAPQQIQAAPPAAGNAQFDQDYASLMAELGEMPVGGDPNANGGQGPMPTGTVPPWRIPSNWCAVLSASESGQRIELAQASASGAEPEACQHRLQQLWRWPSRLNGVSNSFAIQTELTPSPSTALNLERILKLRWRELGDGEQNRAMYDFCIVESVSSKRNDGTIYRISE